MNIQQIQYQINVLKVRLVDEENSLSYYQGEVRKYTDSIESIESQINTLELQQAKLEEFEEIQEEEEKQRLEDSKESHCGHDDVYGSGMDNLTDYNTKEE